MVNRTKLVSVFCSILISLSLLTTALPAQAQTANAQPGVKAEIKNLRAEAQKVAGTLSLNNLSALYYPQLRYSLSLYTPGKFQNTTLDSVRVPLVGSGGLVYTFSKQISLANNAQADFNFELPFNIHLPKGNYSVVASIQTIDNSIIGYANSSISIPTEDNGLVIDPLSCEVIVNSIHYTPTDGPIVGPDGKSFVSCNVKNLNSSSASIQAGYEIEYGAWSVIDSRQDKLNQYNPGEKTLFNPGEMKTVSFKIPSLTEPQVYEGYIYMLDNANNRISAGVPFRWIVGGPSAYIRSVNLDKDSYKKDQPIIATVGVNPPVDLYWRGRPESLDLPYSASAAAALAGKGTDLENATLIVAVVSKDGNQCGSGTINLPNTKDSAWDLQTVKIMASNDCSYPQVKTTVAYNGQTLSSLTKEIPVLVLQSNPLSKPPANKNKNYLYLIGAVILVLIIGVASWYLIKKKRFAKGASAASGQQPPVLPPKTPLAAIFIAAMLLLLFGGKITDLNVRAQTADVVKLPINNPISAENIVITRGMHTPTDLDSFFSNYTNFSQVEASGSSSIVPDPECKAGAVLKLVGYSGNGYVCGNKASGIKYIITIDGQPVQISNFTSPDSTIVKNEINSIIVGGAPGVRTASLSANLAGGLTSGTHKIDIQVITLGLTDWHHSGNFFETSYSSLDDVVNYESLAEGNAWILNHLTLGRQNGQVKNCGTDGKCYGKLSYEWTCKIPPPPPACNETCASDLECQKSGSTCTSCLPNDSGTGTVCRPPAACNVACTRDEQCNKAVDGCTACLPNDSGTGSSCKTPPACNVSCTKDSQCAKSTDGCTACVGGACKPPPACGTACTTKADCSGVKDSCSECLEGTCTDYNDNMCKCDGIVADMTYPGGGNFKFEAFGKVEGTDTKKAEIADITFRMTKDNQVIAKSNAITPQIVETSDTKTRFKADWQTAPPAISKNSTYRVFADVRCKPKRITADAGQTYSPVPLAIKNYAPKGLELVLKGINKLFGDGNARVNALTGRVLALFSTSTVQAQSNLQLQTLNFVKLMDTDNCRFVMFKYDETLF